MSPDTSQKSFGAVRKRPDTGMNPTRSPRGLCRPLGGYFNRTSRKRDNALPQKQYLHSYSHRYSNHLFRRKL